MSARRCCGASRLTVAGYQNNKHGILLVVFKQPGANVIDTVDQIKAAAAAAHRRTFRPRSTSTTLLDRTTTIRASVEDVEFTLV